jgi:sugar lactone lactonase YvrE
MTSSSTTAPPVHESSRRGGWRSRWAAVGAAVAVALGAGGIYIGNAASGSSSFVAITPVRVLDTRTGLGLAGVFTSPVSRDLLVTGSIATADGTQIVVPAGATAVALNVTVVTPTAPGFLSVRPADAAGAPSTSNLNFVAGQVVPNAVTVAIPTAGGDAGRIEITYNAFEVAGPTTHVLVDVVGYFQAVDTGPADGTACTAGGLPGTIINGANGEGEVTVKCFRNLVTTLAGSTAGFLDGAPARFGFPTGVAVDAASNLYIGDQSNHRIRKITPAGVATTLAGSGVAGFADGTGAAAQFDIPQGVAVDGSGNVYVADQNNHRIRKITPAGVVTTLAGSGTAGATDATGAAAQFDSPSGVTVDSAGNLYVGDTGNHRIRKITPAGVVTTLAGSTIGASNGTGAAAQFSSPFGVAVDAAGNVYVADQNNRRIRKVTAAGVVTTLAGSTQGFADGTGAAAQFDTPSGVAVDDAGNVYVADTFNHRIRKITPAGVVTTLAGSTLGSSDGTGAAAQFNNPYGVALDAAGNLYIADRSNHRIREIN